MHIQSAALKSNDMKRFALAVCLMAATVLTRAQEPTTTWPYLYGEFTSGVLLQQGGAEKQALYNVHLLHGKLHFIEDNLIKEINSSDIFSVQIGSDIYVNVNGRMMLVMAKNGNGFVARDNEIDMVKLNSTGGAYGSSSSSVATQALSSLEGIGASNSSSNTNHMELRANKESGQELPLIKKDYMVVDGKVIYATRKDFSAAVGGPAAATFLKENKIKWKEAASVLKAIDFIAQHKQ